MLLILFFLGVTLVSAQDPTTVEIVAVSSTPAPIDLSNIQLTPASTASPLVPNNSLQLPGGSQPVILQLAPRFPGGPPQSFLILPQNASGPVSIPQPAQQQPFFLQFAPNGFPQQNSFPQPNSFPQQGLFGLPSLGAPVEDPRIPLLTRALNESLQVLQVLIDNQQNPSTSPLLNSGLEPLLNPAPLSASFDASTSYQTPNANPSYQVPNANPSYQAPTSAPYSAPVYSAPTSPVYSAPTPSAPAYSAPVYSAPTPSAPAYSAPVPTPVTNYGAQAVPSQQYGSDQDLTRESVRELVTLVNQLLVRERGLLGTSSGYQSIRQSNDQLYSPPSEAYSQPDVTYSSPSHSPQREYNAPQDRYSVPQSHSHSLQSTYNSPQPTYNSPQPAYAAPSSAEPSDSYQTPHTHSTHSTMQGKGDTDELLHKFVQTIISRRS